MRLVLVARRGLYLLAGVLIVVSAVMAASPGAVPQTKQLRFVSTPWSPFTNVKGQPRYALDLVEAGFSRVGITATTSFVDPNNFTTSLLTGPYDGSASTWKDAVREKTLLYSQPYLENRLVVVGRRGADVSAAKLNQLAGKRIAIVGGYSYGDTIEVAGPTFIRSRSEEDSLSLLLASKVDYMLMDELVVDFIVTNHPDEARTRLQIGTTPVLTRALHVSVRRTIPDAESLITRFNTQLRGMIVDGTYHRLLHVDWIAADVTGDGRAELVPRSDKAGTAPPQRAYLLMTAEPGVPKPIGTSQFYIGKTLYNNWTDVPDTYKVSAPGIASAEKSTLSTFTFTWK